MSTRRFTVIIGVGAVVSAVIGVLCYLLAPSANAGFTDTATTLAVISASALGIERLLEAAWAALGSRAGDWWPLDIINREVASFDTDLHAVADRFFDEAASALTVAASVDAQLAGALPAVNDQLERMRTELLDQLKRLGDLSPGSQRTNLIATRVTNAVNLADARFRPLADGITNAVNGATQAIASTADFLAGVRENPGKQLLSIWAGTSIGMVVATALGVDLFAAVFGPDTVSASAIHDPLGVVITGAVIGLGAGPTHEVIRVLQEVKKSRRASNGPAGAIQDAQSAIAALLGGPPEEDATSGVPRAGPPGPALVSAAETQPEASIVAVVPLPESELAGVTGFAGEGPAAGATSTAAAAAPSSREGPPQRGGTPSVPGAVPAPAEANSAAVLAALSAQRPMPRRVGTYNIPRN